MVDGFVDLLLWTRLSSGPTPPRAAQEPINHVDDVSGRPFKGGNHRGRVARGHEESSSHCQA
jgi:hypothetical protein